MTPEQAIAEARSRELRPVYLVVGEEHRLQSDVLAALRSAALEAGVPGLNDDQWVAGEVDVDQVLGAARTLPMLSKLRLVVVRSLERWEPRDGAKSAKTKQEPLDKLAEYVKAPVPSTLLVLLAGKLDKRRRLVTTAQKAGCLVACEPLARAELPGWIERRAAACSSRLAPGVADLVAELAGPDLAPVADAVERLCLYAGAGETVTEEHVAECLVRLRTASVWQLVDAVGRRDVARALATLHEVYDPEDRGIRLVGVLAWSARQLVKFESATRAGLAPEAAAQRAGAPPFKARELARQVQRIPKDELERWLETLAAVDLALKGGSKRPPKAVLEQAIVALCSSTAAGADARARPRPSGP
jgi:DNA polymerase III subunit delta